MKLDIIVPTYNEEENVERFYDKVKSELKGISYNIIFVDDGSQDKTLSRLKNLYKNDKDNIRVISFSKNYGKDAAIYAGLKYSRNDYACIIDADLQQNPKYLVKMFNFLKENEEYDIVCMCQGQKKNRFFQKCFYKLMSRLSGYNFENGASDFRMLKKKVVKSILDLSEKNRFTKGIFAYVGYNTYYDTYKVEKREYGNTKFKFKSLLNYAFNGIIAFSTKPLRFATLIGSITSISAFIYLIVVLIRTLIVGIKTPGYASIMCVMLFLGGIQLICIGLVGEYIGKIYNETKNRPIFIEKERIGFDEDIL